METIKNQLEKDEQIFWSQCDSRNILWEQQSLLILLIIIVGSIYGFSVYAYISIYGSINFQVFFFSLGLITMIISPLLLIFLLIEIISWYNFKKIKKTTNYTTKELKNYEYWEILTNKRLIIKDHNLCSRRIKFNYPPNIVNQEIDLTFIYLKDFELIKMSTRYNDYDDIIELDLMFYVEKPQNGYKQEYRPFNVIIEWRTEDEYEKFKETFSKYIPNSILKMEE